MWYTIFVAILVCLLLLWIGIVKIRRKNSENEPATFVCSDCGQMDCICHLEEKK